MSIDQMSSIDTFFRALYLPLQGVEGEIIFAPDTRGRCYPTPVGELLSQDDLTPADDRPLFFTPGVFTPGSVDQATGRGRRDENVQAIACLFLDYDAEPFEESRLLGIGLPRPHFVFRRGSRAHVYYKIEPVYFTKAEDRKIYRETLKKLAKLTGADPLPAHEGSYIRAPGSLHVKRGQVSTGAERSYLPDLSYTGEGERLDVHEVRRLVLAAWKPQTGEPEEQEQTGPEALSVRETLLAPRPILREGEGRSNALFQFGGRCRDFGLSEDEAQELAKEFNAKYFSPPEPDDVVRHQVYCAYAYAKTPPGRYLREKKSSDAIERFFLDEHVAKSLSGWAYVLGNESLRSKDGRKAYTTQGQIQNALYYMTGTSVRLSYVLQHRLVTVVDTVTFRPDVGDRFLTMPDGQKALNVYASPDLPRSDNLTEEERQEAVNTFLEHLRLLTTCEDEYHHLLQYIALTLTRPGVKLKHSILLVSDRQGLGKSLLQALYESVLGRYVISPSNDDIASGRNSWMDSALACFVHETGITDRFNVLGHLRNWITEPTIPITDKYIRSYNIDNYCNFFFFSNNVNALPVGEYERRFYVIVNRKTPRPSEYYRSVYQAFTRGAGAIYEYLSGLDITLDPNAPAPLTAGRKEMSGYSRSEFFLYLDDLRDSGELSGILEGPGFSIRRLYDHIELTTASSRTRGLMSQKQLTIWLRENEYETVRVFRTENGARRSFRLYTKDPSRLKDLKLEELKKL